MNTPVSKHLHSVDNKDRDEKYEYDKKGADQVKFFCNNTTTW